MPLSLKTSLFALVLLPRIVTSPVIVVAFALIVPSMSMRPVPPKRALLMVPPVTIGASMVLLLRVSVAS